MAYSDIYRELSSRLLLWYQENARTLPWRENHDPYRIWISEIMLQQTQVNTVIPYYLKFIKRFPTIQELASASEDEVLSYWSGLGYYKRARQLHESAQIIVEQYEGCVPQRENDILKLPGIGPYTAGAIMSIAFNLSQPVLDGNVIRVISRVFAIRESTGLAATKRLLWSIARDSIPDNMARSYNQALMELGALVCLPSASSSLCNTCPVNDICQSKKLELISEIPVLPEKRKREKLFHIAFLITKNDKFLIRKRQDHNVLKNIWEAPWGKLNDESPDKTTVIRIYQDEMLCEPKNLSYLSKVKHSITYRDITCHVYQISLSDNDSLDISSESFYEWVTRDELGRFPHSSLLKKISALLGQSQQELFQDR